MRPPRSAPWSRPCSPGSDAAADAVPAGRAAGEADVSRLAAPDERPGLLPHPVRRRARPRRAPTGSRSCSPAEDGTGVLHVLAGVAPALWRAADAASVADLTAAAIAAYGPPGGDAAALVEAAADELVEAGVLADSGDRERTLEACLQRAPSGRSARRSATAFPTMASRAAHRQQSSGASGDAAGRPQSRLSPCDCHRA